MTSASRLAGREILLLWGIAGVLGLVGAIWVLSLIFNVDVPPSEAFYEHNIGRVQRFAELTDAGAIGVVMFGDSRMRYGTATDAELATELSEQLGGDVAVLRLVNNWAVFEDFEPLVPMIIDADPDLVVIQNELRVKDRADDAGSLLKREYIKWRVFGRGPWNPGDLDQEGLQSEMRCEVLLDEGVEARRERVFRWVDFNGAGPNAGKVAAFTAQLDAEAIGYRYLTVPVTTIGQQGLPGVDPVPEPLGLSPDVAIADDQFCDIVHMDPDGRSLYTGWFVDTVAGQLRNLNDLATAS